MPRYERVRLTHSTSIKYREVAERAGIEHPRVWTANDDPTRRLGAALIGEEVHPSLEANRESVPLGNLPEVKPTRRARLRAWLTRKDK